MKRLIKISFLIASYFFVLGSAVSVQADTTDIQGASFSKKVQHPDNQIGTGEALNLMMTPGQKQQVKVEITNYNDKEIVVEAKIAGARTNGSGGLEYSPNKLPHDKSMKYDLPDLVKIPSEIKVPAKGKEDLIVDITMPDASYDGIITGGIQLMEKGKGVESLDDKGATIVNKIAFLFGVTLRMNDTKIEPDFKLNTIKPGLQNYRNAIFVNLSNTQSMIAENLVLNAEITLKGKSDVLYQKKKTDVSMAPNSIMNYPVSLDGDAMKAGDYTAHVILKGYGKEWKWDKHFTITDEEADEFNKKDPYLVQERGIDWKTIALIVVGVVVLVGIVLITRSIMKKKKSKKKSSTKKKATRRK
ncbi:MAG: DUF916 and DUF3324 domain-containing protein [Vagococcus sp.]